MEKHFLSAVREELNLSTLNFFVDHDNCKCVIRHCLTTQLRVHLRGERKKRTRLRGRRRRRSKQGGREYHGTQCRRRDASGGRGGSEFVAGSGVSHRDGGWGWGQRRKDSRRQAKSGIEEGVWNLSESVGGRAVATDLVCKGTVQCQEHRLESK